MLIVLLVVQLVVLLAVVALYVRKPVAVEPDPRLGELADQLTRLDAYTREALAQMRSDIPNEASRTRKENEASALALRNEVIGNISTLGETLTRELAKFGVDNTSAADRLRSDVEQKMRSISQGFADFKNELSGKQSALQESLNAKLIELMTSNAAHQDKLRASVEQSLATLNKDNTAKLEEMRVTVDEKLQSTLNERLTQSFGQVTTHLGEVQKGLGEMKELATGVGDLKKMFSNVKSRGGIGEFLVGQQLEQMFSPEQYVKQYNIKPGTGEAVDYALKFPNGETGSFVLLPIDAKFPRSDWELLEEANEHGTVEEIAAAGKAFERAIRTQGKKISDKYIDPPTTMPQAIMVLPTEGLYAEVVRRPGLQSELQSTYRVTVAGPSTFMAILTSFQMGFHTLAIQQKGDEVWKVLSKAKNEFNNFGTLMEKVEKQVGTVQKTLGKIRSKTTTINRSLKNVSNLDAVSPTANLLEFEESPGIAPSLAATSEED